MPRPKRTKVASRAAPARVANPSKPAAPAAEPQKTQQPPAVQDSFSDDSDGLVVKATRTRAGRRAPWQREPQKDADFTMTGALPTQEEGTGGAGNETDSIARRIPTPSSHTPHNRRSSGRRATDTSPADARLPTLSAQDALGLDEESSLLDPSLLTFGSLDSDSPAHGTRPPSAIKVGATPAHEMSILALTNFKRRGRQPSLLRLVHPTTDVEDNDPDDFDDFDDFDPDDESTPLRVRKAEAVAQVHDTSTLSSASAGSRGKKRKLSSPVVQVPRSSPPAERTPAADVADVVHVEESQRSSSPSLPDNVSQTQEDAEAQELPNPEVMSETMAPPRSSSPPEDVQSHSADTALQKTGRGRRDASAEEDNGRKRQAKPTRKQAVKAQTISTARLQALLPRRRTRVTREHDEYEITSDDTPVTSFDSDQDELQLPAPRARKLATNPKPKTSRPAKKPGIPTGGKGKSTRTYTRRTSSDKENGSTLLSNEDSGAPLEATETATAVSNPKLAAIAKKFEDVDAWEMQFESVDVGGGSSSPWR